MDVGDRDTPNVADFRAFDQALTDANILHQAETYEGGHKDRRGERIALAMRYFSDVLLTDELPGDFNGNRVIDANDIDLLSEAIRTGSHDPDPRMDLNEDGAIGPADRELWIHGDTFRFTYVGDANLDGEFNSGDLVAVFQAAEYEDSINANSGWATGDWNGDNEFDSSDLVFGFQDGGFELGPRKTPEVAKVPEPTAGLLAIFSSLSWALIARQTRHGSQEDRDV
jgi:hypothetical protein